MSLKPLFVQQSLDDREDRLESQAHRGLDVLVFALILLLLLAIFRRAWLSDDAFITFRVVDNFIHGYGLTFNITERVQAYTHPLWMFLISFFYFFFRDPAWMPIWVGLGVTAITMVLLIQKLSLSKSAGVIALLVLVFSQAFLDYSTSGLENPLSHLLIVLFCIQLFAGNRSPRWLGLLSLTASLGILNRMDLGLVFAPGLLYGLWVTRPFKKALPAILLGQLPFILWEIFSVIYYGFPFPNTAYAKLSTGISQLEYIQQGLMYILYSLQFDPVTIFGILLAGVAVWKCRSAPMVALGLGTLLYIGYILEIGGDFMGGRFFTVPLICAVIMLVRSDLIRKQSIEFALIAVVILIVGVFVPGHTAVSITKQDPKADTVFYNGITDERDYYSWGSSIWSYSRGSLFPSFYMQNGGLKLKNSGQKVAVEGSLGMTSFYAGPTVHVLDEYALADPLLARIPAKRLINWRIGHFARAVPKGYLETLAQDKDLIEDPELALYYDQLKKITQGDLFSPGRFQAIWDMNLGKFNHDIDQDTYRYFDRVSAKYSQIKTIFASEVMTCKDDRALKFKDAGLEIRSDTLLNGSSIDLAVNQGSDYQLALYKDEQLLLTQPIPFGVFWNDASLSRVSIPLPPSVKSAGFNRIRLIPQTWADPFCLGHFKINP